MAERIFQLTLPPELAAIVEYYVQGVTPPTPADAAAARRHGHHAPAGQIVNVESPDDLLQSEILHLGENALDANGGSISGEELAYREVTDFEAAGLTDLTSTVGALRSLGIVGNAVRLDAAVSDAAPNRDYSGATALSRRDMNRMLNGAAGH